MKCLTGQARVAPTHAEARQHRESPERTGHPPQPRPHWELGHRPLLGLSLSPPTASSSSYYYYYNYLRMYIVVGFFWGLFYLLKQDIIARFGKQEMMPREFFTDFVKVAQDEGRHFTLLTAASGNWVLSMARCRPWRALGFRHGNFQGSSGSSRHCALCPWGLRFFFSFSFSFDCFMVWYVIIITVIVCDFVWCLTWVSNNCYVDWNEKYWHIDYRQYNRRNGRENVETGS